MVRNVGRAGATQELEAYEPPLPELDVPTATALGDSGLATAEMLDGLQHAALLRARRRRAPKAVLAKLNRASREAWQRRQDAAVTAPP